MFILLPVINASIKRIVFTCNWLCIVMDICNDTEIMYTCSIPHVHLSYMHTGRPICVYSYRMSVRVWDSLLCHTSMD